MNEVTACRSVLIEVLTILGKDLDKVAVIGGWVPELAFPNQGRMALSAVPTFSNTKAYLCLGDRLRTGPRLGLSAHPVSLHRLGIFRERIACSCFFWKKQLPIPGREAFPA